jgi:ribosomal silencing factor RsfS
MDEKFGGLTKLEYEEAEKLIDPERMQAQSISNISKKGNFREIKRVIDLADVIIHVLDSRDPEGTRS